MVGVAWLSENWSKGALLHYCLDATGWMWVFSTVFGVGEGVENPLFCPAVEVWSRGQRCVASLSISLVWLDVGEFDES
jgi:hypothetical protein